MQPQLRRRFTSALGQHANELTEKICTEVRSQHPNLFSAEFAVAMRYSTRSNIQLFKDFVESDGDPRTVQPGSSIRQIVQVLISRGMPLAQLIMIFHSTHNILEQELLRLIHKLHPKSSGAEIMDILSQLRALTNTYVRLRSSQLPAIYAEEASRLRIPGDPELLAQVQGVLRAPQKYQTIGDYQLTGAQVAFQLWTPSTQSMAPEQMINTATQIAELIETRTMPLLVHATNTQLWAWCTLDPQTPHDAHLNRPHDDYLQLLPPNIHLSLAACFHNPRAFLQTHAQADRLRRLVELQANPPRMLRSNDNGALTAGAFVDRLPLAKALTQTVLGPLDAPEESATAIRETARSFYRYGISTAAKHLGVHRNTIKYRMDKFRETLGASATASSEILLALELAHWLDTPNLDFMKEN